MEWSIIGTIIGLVMGLTGSGGALVAIPLFITLLDKSLKDASILSLYVVILASFVNFITQRKDTNYLIAAYVFIGSIIGSSISKPFKEIVPDIVIALLLAIISVFSLYSVWKKKIILKSHHQDINFVKSFSLGGTLGVLTTMTGLGGGVLLMPAFLGIFKLPENMAVATSLLTISFSSLYSLFIQRNDLNMKLGIYELGPMILGITISLFLLKLLLKTLPEEKMIRMRKLVFTFLVTFSLYKIF